jgi:ATPase subunit of ABC transporter with duplicated ATPase domains
VISVSGLSLRFGKKVLFDSVTLKFRPGLVYGIIGANGAGKTTFLKILSGEIKPTEGQIVLDPGVKLGMLRQDHYSFEDQTVMDTVLMGNEELHKIEKEKDALYAKPNMSDKEAERAAELEIRFGELDGYSSASRAAELLDGLGIESSSHNKLMKELTGGWKVRVLLAQILYAKPDLLLLDEPTNALDIASINWLEDYLNDYEGTIIMVSHDRHFLNRTCTYMVDIDRPPRKRSVSPSSRTSSPASGPMPARAPRRPRATRCWRRSRSRKSSPVRASTRVLPSSPKPSSARISWRSLA